MTERTPAFYLIFLEHTNREIAMLQQRFTFYQHNKSYLQHKIGILTVTSHDWTLVRCLSLQLKSIKLHQNKLLKKITELQSQKETLEAQLADNKVADVVSLAYEAAYAPTPKQKQQIQPKQNTKIYNIFKRRQK